MRMIQVNGIVIRCIRYGDHDKIITLATKEKGRITVMAKGAMSSKSRLHAVTRFLTCSRYTLYSGRNFYYIKDTEFLKSYENVALDVEKLTYCCHFTDMMFDALPQEQAFPEAVTHFLYTIAAMDRATLEQYESIRVLFELRLLVLMGYAPQIDRCSICEKPIESEAIFSIERDGLCCANHALEEPHPILAEPDVQRVLAHLVKAKPHMIYRLVVPVGALRTLQRISERFIEKTLDKQYSKMSLLDGFKT